MRLATVVVLREVLRLETQAKLRCWVVPGSEAVDVELGGEQAVVDVLSVIPKERGREKTRSRRCEGDTGTPRSYVAVAGE